ncbi:MAG: NAD(+) synthase, partial [Calditrichaeota bacterium]|nr:NAD(+) synthase [Calditrichota bacterium]
FAVRDYFRKNQFEKAIVGLSGGIDSALVAVLAQQALGKDHLLGVAMPSKYSSDHSVEDAERLAKNLGIAYKKIPISDIHRSYEQHFNEIFNGQDISIADENIQARIRANILMAHSNQEGYILLSTSNKTELALGYSTLYGDMSGAVAVIGDLSKMRVYELARYINQEAGKELIPQRSIDKEPSAELRPEQVDPFDYDEISPLIDLIIEGRKSIEDLLLMEYDEELLRDIFNKIRSNEFKRFQAPIIFKVTSKAFGPGRIYPKMNRYKNEG